VRLSPWWLVQLGRGFYIRPGGAVQWLEGGSWLGSYFGELGVAGSHGTLYLGAKGGRERRPTYLLVPLMLNIVDDITWGVWAGGSLRLSDRAELRAVYRLDRLEPLVDAGRQQSYMHAVALSLGFWL